jgi:D-arginine dehydrogenase
VNRAVDFVVVGAGIAGTSAAYELAAHGSVKVFEMEATPGHHSTGRSAALYTECDGLPPLRRLAMASRPFLTNPPAGFAAVPVMHQRGVLFVARHDRATKLDRFFEEQKVLVPSISRLEVAEAAERCSVLRPDRLAGGVLEPEAHDIDVHALHQGFIGGLRSRGGTIATSTPVIGLEKVGGSWRVTTPSDTIEAGIVVNAAGAWCDVVARMAGVRPVGLQPKRRTAFTFPAPGGHDHQRWPMVVDVDETFYFRPEGPNLLASPEDQTPVDPQDIRHEELDVAVAIDRIQDVTTMQIRHVQAAWAGLRSFVADNVPVVGFDDEAAGFFWLAGQGGYGIMTSPAMSRLTAALITSNEMPADIAAHGITEHELAPGRLRQT